MIEIYANWSTPPEIKERDNSRDTIYGLLFMSYLVFGTLATFIWPLVIFHYSHWLGFASVLAFPLMWVVGLHYLIQWMKIEDEKKDSQSGTQL